MKRIVVVVDDKNDYIVINMRPDAQVFEVVLKTREEYEREKPFPYYAIIHRDAGADSYEGEDEDIRTLLEYATCKHFTIIQSTTTVCACDGTDVFESRAGKFMEEHKDDVVAVVVKQDNNFIYLVDYEKTDGDELKESLDGYKFCELRSVLE